MKEELKGLIEKINEEGIRSAEEKAKQIEADAQREAQEIVRRAELKAKGLISEAEERIAKLQESSKASLKQAARDLLISLRKHVNAMLEGLITANVHKALTPEEMAKLIAQLVRDYKAKDKGEIIVHLKKEDLERIEKAFLGELGNEAKKGVVLKASDEMGGGFIISYDSGKSYYDFTDKSLAEYLFCCVKPKLSELLGDITM